MKPTLALHKLPLYNTGRLDDQDIIAAFSARQPVFERIIADLSAENGDSRAQHHLLVGQRGMGKTMLLARIAAEIRTGPLGERLIPLVFAEEQYAVDRLSKFWLNCLDSLADARDRAGDKAGAEKIDVMVEQLTAKLPGAAKDDAPLARDALEAFLEAAASLHRRPVLLVDNLQLVFERISEDQQHALREVLMRPGCPVLVGASPVPPPESQDYGAAFYDHFKVHYLRPLEVEEMKALMLHLAEISQRPAVRERILQHPQRLPVLRQLTGGNPRTTATLFFLYAEDFAPSVFGDLENLLDRVTPLYKARFEELAKQQQVIASAIANHWDPVTSRTLAEITGLPMTGISPQLDRLEKTGFIERVSLFEQSSTGYQIAERFFNVWFLMRSASRRQRREVEFLTRFIENFYEAQDRSRIAAQLLTERDLSPDRHLFARALAAALDDKASATDLERHTQLDALWQKAADVRRRLDEVLDLESLPPVTLAFSELRERLMALVPAGASIEPEEFASAALSNRRMFMQGTRESLVRGRKTLTQTETFEIIEKLQQERKLDEEEYGGKPVEWLSQRLSTGQLRHVSDLEDWNRSFLRTSHPGTTQLMLDSMPLGLGSKLDEETVQHIRAQVAPRDDAPYWDWFFWGLSLDGKFLLLSEAERAYRKSTTMEPDFPYSWIGLGDVLLKQLHRNEEAESAYRRAVDIEPELPHAWNGLGSVLRLDRKRSTEAEQAFRRALEIEPNSSPTWNNLGNLLHEAFDRPTEAEAAYRRAIDLSPEHPSAWSNLGNLLQKIVDRDEECEAAYRRAIELDPKFPYAWNGLGSFLWRSKSRVEEAEAAYRHAIEIDPHFSSALNNLAILLMSTRRSWEEAKEICTSLIELNSFDAGAWNSLGLIHFDHLGDLQGAESALESSLVIDPYNPAPLHNMIFLQRDYFGRVDLAAQLARRLGNEVPATFRDLYFIQKSIFSAYEQNWGTSRDAIVKALQFINTGFPSNSKDDWLRASAVFIHLNYGKELLALLEDRGDHLRLRPWYEALRALHLGDRGHLQNIAPEVRTTAEAFFDQIEHHLNALPAATRRRPLPKPKATKKRKGK